MIRQLEGMDRVMTEDFVKNKQEAEVVNSGTEKSSLSMADVESENGVIAVKRKNVNRALWLSVTLFFITVVLHFQRMISEYPAILFESFIFIIILFLFDYKREISKNNKENMIKKKGHLDAFWFVALFFAVNILYVFGAILGAIAAATMLRLFVCNFLMVIFFMLDMFVIYRYSEDEEPEINYRKFFESCLIGYVLIVFYALILDCFLMNHYDSLFLMIFNELRYQHFLYFLISLPVSIFVVSHYNFFQKFHFSRKREISGKKGRNVIILLILLNLLPFYVFIIMRTLWGWGLIRPPSC